MFTGSRCPNRIPIQSITQLPSYKETSSLKVAVENKFDIQHHNCLNSNRFLKFIYVYLRDLRLFSKKTKCEKLTRPGFFGKFRVTERLRMMSYWQNIYMLHGYLSSTFLHV
jgi:hypothetical protein